MDEIHDDAAEPEIQDSEALIPNFDVDVATVSVVDGIWQDQPDNVATFVEARLGELARGRGNLYVCLDVSGDVEGRSEIERALIEVIRDTFASSRGSISFALSEALRAANAHLYESNRQVAREARRMAGVSAVILRGNDLYVAQAGPAVVYVEASEKFVRYPHESDWFVEDAPMIAPQGTASAPLGIRREFASDLAHASIGVGDVFVLATRGLTQLATTEELAIAFTERSAQEIARHLEEVGQDADITALVAELMDPNAPRPVESLDLGTHEHTAHAPHIESLPVPLGSLVSLDPSEPPVEEEEDDDEEFEEEEEESEEAGEDQEDREPELVWDEPAAPVPAPAVVEHELDWGDETDDETETSEEEDEEPEQRQPVFASAAAAAMPMMRAPAQPAPPQPTRAEWEAELERRRAERAAQRTVQKENISRAVGGVTSTIGGMAGAAGGVYEKTLGAVDWDAIGKRTNRFLNLGVGAIISFFLLLVRLVLPGAMPRATSLIPRRATSDPVWLKAMAFVLPVLFLALAGGSFLNRQNTLNAQYDDLVNKADTIVKQAEVNPDPTQKRAQLNDALKIVAQAQAFRETTKSRGVLYRIQDQLNEMDGVAVLYFLPTLAQLNGAHLKAVAASEQDIFLLDGRGRVYQYVVNDASGATDPAPNEGLILQVGAQVGEVKVDALQLLTSATPTQNKATMVAITKNAILSYDLEGKQWTASKVDDASKWGDLRAIASFGANIYLLDGQNNQIYRYSPNATGYSNKGVGYFAAGQQPVLSKAVDLAIDGDVWVLNDNGSVLRFRAGTPIPFELGVLPSPLKNPVAIYTRPEVDSLYIADAGNQRIVEFDKNGKFVRQFKPYSEKGDVFRNLQDFTVNETKRKLYFVNSDAAYMANIPK